MWRSLVGLVCASLLTFACARKAETEKVAAPALPEGDPQAGKVAFQDLRCWACHEIYGGDMPKPVAQPPMPVYLGGNQIEAPSDIDLLNAIVSPSHELAPGWGTELTTSGKGSRMGDYGGVMTAKQLFDVIAFVKSRYGAAAEANVKRQTAT